MIILHLVLFVSLWHSSSPANRLSFLENYAVTSHTPYHALNYNPAECTDPSAFDCSVVNIDIKYLHIYGKIQVWDNLIKHVVFGKSKEWTVKDSRLIEYVPITPWPDSKPDDDGSLIIIYSLRTEEYFCFIEYHGMTFTIHSEGEYGFGILQRWFKKGSKMSPARNNSVPIYFPIPHNKARHSITKEVEGDDVLIQFPHYYHAIGWSYARNPKITNNDDYRFSLLQGLHDASKNAEVSVTIMLTGSVFHSFGIKDPIAMNMVAVHLINEFNHIMDNTGVPLTFKLHCISLTDETALNLTVSDKYRQPIRIKPGEDLEALMHHYNYDWYGEKFRGKKAFSTDITIVIRDDIGERSSIAAVGGIQDRATTIFIRKEFVFQKYLIMHAIGHMIGCGHIPNTNPSHIKNPWESQTDPLMFYAQSYTTKKGYCDVMADPYHKNCTTLPVFSTPYRLYNGEHLGTIFANNGLWVLHNRFFLSNIGDEMVKCSDIFLYYPLLTECLLEKSATIKQLGCTDKAPRWTG